jgi:uncharacterized cupin superfamily protein
MPITDILLFDRLRQQPWPEPEEGRPDPEKLLSGEPVNRTWNLYESADGKLFAGVWESEPGKWRIAYDETEYCTILEGHSILTDEDSQTLDLHPGTSFLIPPGFKGTWEVVEKTRKEYVVYV